MSNNAARVSASWNGRRWVDSPAARRQRIESLVAKLDDLRAAMLDQERAAYGLDMLAIERLEYTRANVAITEKAILIEVRAMLATCPVHVEGSLISGCADCVAVADRRGGPPVPSEIRLATRRR